MSQRSVAIFRYDPCKGGEGDFEEFTLDIPDEAHTTILDVLLRIQREQDPTLSFRYACRVNMCGSCGMVINGKEGLACKTNVSDIPAGRKVTLRPLNHFPVIKDLVVDMAPFFKKYEESMPYFEPRGEPSEPAKIQPDSSERLDIGQATECIACGCCVSSCTMFHYHAEYLGPAALNRAFTLLADSRDSKFDERMQRVLDSCYACRTELNCTEVCPKDISGTRAIKYIQRLALTRRKNMGRRAARSRQEAAAVPAAPPARSLDRRDFLRQVGVGVLGAGTVLVLGGVLGTAMVAPTLVETPAAWHPVGDVSDIAPGDITTRVLRYELKNGIYTQAVTENVLISRTGDAIVCFKSSCTHLGCIVHWDPLSQRFLCACHGGTFDRDGNVLAGPPPRPLDRYAFKVESGQLLVEVG